MQKFGAKLIRERFVLTRQNRLNEEPQLALGNRLEFECYDSRGEKSARFVVRAQNVHTTLRIAARVARHWYDHGDVQTSGPNRFNWKYEYKETTKEFEEKWNPECWACIYRNGKILFGAEPPDKTQLFDIIEQVYAYEKGDYGNIAGAAEEMFAKAGKNIAIEYDGDMAMELVGTPESVKNRIIYRDTDGRNKMELQMKQKDMSYLIGEKGSPVKLSECLTVAAVIFEGYQLGFFAGRTNYHLSSGKIDLSNKDAQQTDHAIKRVIRLDQALKDLTNKYHLSFRPKPNFQQNISKVEGSFREMGRSF